MNREKLQTFLVDFVDNVSVLSKLDSTLKAVVPFSEKNGVTPTQLMTKIAKISFDNWHHDLCSDMMEFSERSLLEGAFYARLANMASDEMLAIMDNPGEWDKALINELRFDIRIYISNLTKAIDAFTGLYNRYITCKIVNKIEQTMSVSDSKREQLNALKWSVKLNHDIATLVGESFSDESKLDGALAICGRYLIKPDLLMDDIVLRIKYDDCVCKQAKEILEPFMFTLTRHFATKVIEASVDDAQIVVAQEIEDFLGTADCTISLIQDYETLYFDIMRKEEPWIRDVDITGIPSAIIEEALLEGKPTEALIAFLKEPKITEETTTGEF